MGRLTPLNEEEWLAQQRASNSLVLQNKDVKAGARHYGRGETIKDISHEEQWAQPWVRQPTPQEASDDLGAKIEVSDNAGAAEYLIREKNSREWIDTTTDLAHLWKLTGLQAGSMRDVPVNTTVEHRQKVIDVAAMAVVKITEEHEQDNQVQKVIDDYSMMIALQVLFQE